MEPSKGEFNLCARQNDANMPVCALVIYDGVANKTTIWLFHYKNGAKSPAYVPVNSSFNYTRGLELKLNILAGSQGYVIFKDGQLVSNYTYVLPLSSVQSFVVIGDAQLIEFNL